MDQDFWKGPNVITLDGQKFGGMRTYVPSRKKAFFFMGAYAAGAAVITYMTITEAAVHTPLPGFFLPLVVIIGFVNFTFYRRTAIEVDQNRLTYRGFTSKHIDLDDVAEIDLVLWSRNPRFVVKHRDSFFKTVRIPVQYFDGGVCEQVALDIQAFRPNIVFTERVQKAIAHAKKVYSEGGNLQSMLYYSRQSFH